ncbi:ATP-binding protein [Paenibacillus sp. HB172176]|uniref:sensor histidine kinase n=1 Tax=Paenibacillus sp. HB172176 TaxID=2493690 RepID=UPI001438AAB5|nr:ATP-binding protein [Paenibacillus sp. HB172176]
MITTMIIAAALATVIIALNPRNPSLRWLSASLYSGSLMIVVFLLDLKYPDAPNLFINAMIFLTDVAMAYTLCMFGVVYSGLAAKKTCHKLIALGLLLIGIVWLLTPLTPTRRINYEGDNELPVVLFVILCMTTGILLLLIANWKENHPYKRIERTLTSLFIVPTMLYIAISYLFYYYEIDLFRFNYLFAFAFLTLFIIIGIKQGALGVRIKLEMLKTDASLHVLKSGSSLLNHTIKNEIGKVDILLHQMRHSIKDKDQAAHLENSEPELEDMLTMAADSVHHIQSMMSKINERVQAIEVKLIQDNLAPIVVQCLDAFEKTAGEQLIINRKLEQVSDMYYDPVHIKEVIHNLLANAAEAMEDKGVITVTLREMEHEIVLQITDTGEGIPKSSIPALFEPFYSTKSKSNNYGLGLFYCKNVMLQHHGTIHAESVLGQGSRFSLRFHL